MTGAVERPSVREHGKACTLLVVRRLSVQSAISRGCGESLFGHVSIDELWTCECEMSPQTYTSTCGRPLLEDGMALGLDQCPESFERVY